jgi:hypothetical protein
MIWHVLSSVTEYAYARPSFKATKLHKLELMAGAPRAYDKAGSARDYWIKEIRDREARYVARPEQAYERMVAALKPKPEKSFTEWRLELLNTIRGDTDGRVVAMQSLRGQHMGLNAPVQRHESVCGRADLVSQRGHAEWYAFASETLGLPVEGLVLPVFLKQQHRQEAGPRPVPRHDMEWSAAG